MKRFCLLTIVVFLIVGFASASNAQAADNGQGSASEPQMLAPITVGAPWFSTTTVPPAFFWNPADGPFDYAHPGNTAVYVTDDFLTGDQFEVFDNFVSLGVTNPVAAVGGGEIGPDAAFADPTYSSGCFNRPAGVHSISLDVIVNPFGSGRGYIQVLDGSCPGTLVVDIDIKFCSDPNAFNCKKKGVLPVTIFGADDVDVADIDPTTLQLCRADGGGCTGGPRGWSYADRGDPLSDIGAGMCAINPDTGEEEDFLTQDGLLDMDAAFEATEVQDLLEDFCDMDRNAVSDALVISGLTYDGLEVFSFPVYSTGVDQLVKKGK